MGEGTHLPGIKQLSILFQDIVQNTGQEEELNKKGMSGWPEGIQAAQLPASVWENLLLYIILWLACRFLDKAEVRGDWRLTLKEGELNFPLSSVAEVGCATCSCLGELSLQALLRLAF